MLIRCLAIALSVLLILHSCWQFTHNVYEQIMHGNKSIGVQFYALQISCSSCSSANAAQKILKNYYRKSLCHSECHTDSYTLRCQYKDVCVWVCVCLQSMSQRQRRRRRRRVCWGVEIGRKSNCICKIHANSYWHLHWHRLLHCAKWSYTSTRLANTLTGCQDPGP